jgi:hypothetical protein
MDEFIRRVLIGSVVFFMLGSQAGLSVFSTTKPGEAAAEGERMSEFQAKSIQLRGGFRLSGPVNEVFPLFSPLGEKSWVPEWSPELIHPPGVSWQRGQVFRTREEQKEAVWIVTQLNPELHEVEYYRVEPGRYVARVAVLCTSVPEGQTEVHTEYDFVGLSESGNAEISAMDTKSYDAKMKRWQGRISDSLAKKP